jgi:cyanophycin synthetase
MDIFRIRALRGPNLWSRNTAMEALVRCEAPHEQAIDSAFEARMRQRFPGLGLFTPIDSRHTLSLAHALETATLHLQIEAGCRVTFSRATPTNETGLYQVVVEYSVEEVGRLALELAQALCRSALDDTPFDATAAVAQLRELDEDLRLGPSTDAIVQAAVNRGIPFRRLTSGSMVQLGWGSKQRRIQAAEIDATSAIAESIAQDKALTKRLLHAAGVPVPLGEVVEHEQDAWAVAQRIGLPVVVKPLDGNQGKGVTVNIRSEAEVVQAYRNASAFAKT